METSLLATKFFIPRVIPGLVIRPRLVQKLQSMLNNRLTLVSAPAGFGKTTILSQWIQESHIPTTWFSLEEAENDPVRFWDYFIGASRKISPSVGEKALPILHSSQPIPIESILNILINDITAVTEDFVLVLDDYYFIHSEAVHQGLTYFIEHIPPVMHLVIVTRVDPPLPLARFRGKGAMLEIGTDDLRFNTGEASGLLASLMGQALAEKDLEAINTRAEGWAVGLKMAALSLGKQKDIKESIAAFTGSQRYIMDYLVEEVLGHQSQDVRDFLLKTSVLARVCGSLCDAVTQGTGGHERLLNLEKANLFLIPLDESREWYRYHHLFAELLRHQLDLEYGKEMAYELHRKASRWYEDNSLFEESIDHALAARDWERAMDLVIDLKAIGTHGGLTVYNWLRRVPMDRLVTRPRACILYSAALAFMSQYKEAKIFIEAYEKSGVDDPLVISNMAITQTMIAAYQCDPGTEEYARKALSLISPEDNGPRAAILLHLGIYFISQNQLNNAETWLEKTYELCSQDSSSSQVDLVVSRGYIANAALMSLAAINLVRGRLHQAAEMFNRVIETGQSFANTAAARTYLSMIYSMWNDLEAATNEREKAFISYPSLSIQGTIYLSNCNAFLVQGNINGAADALEKAEQVIIREDATAKDRAQLAACHVALAMDQEDSIAVSRWLDKLWEYEEFLAECPVKVIKLLHERYPEKMAERMKAEYERSTKQGRWLYVMITCIALSLVSSHTDEALKYLTEALTIGKPEGQIRPFVNCGMLIAPLLRQLITKRIEPEFAQKLLTIIESEDRQRKIRQGELPPSSVSSTILSEREMEVLHLLASGLSDRQIANKLVISLSTAKTHVHRILEKLNVTSRMQAVTQAKELKLL